ncbi:MAG: peptide deformylase [Fusobacteriaceae bacterium]
MIYDIKIYGDEVLRKKSTEVEVITEEILEILNNMVETMHDVKGIGLAAPQIGVNKRMFVLDIGDGKVRKVINPKLEYFGDIIECEEGCLSVPGIYRGVKRPEGVIITYLDTNGETVVEEATELLGRAFQHEYDHLDGILYVDKVSPVSKRLISKKLKNLEKNR